MKRAAIAIALAIALDPMTSFAATVTVTVNPDGSFTPSTVTISNGDSVRWELSGTGDSIIPINWDGHSAGYCSAVKPFLATDRNEFAGPPLQAVSGVFTLSSLDAGYVVETKKSLCSNASLPRATAGNEMLCRGGAYEATLDSTWQDPSLAGVFIRLLWKDIQTAPGTADANFDFSVLDREMNKAVKNGKVFSIGIKAGDDGTPLWLFTNGVTPLQLQDSGSDDDGDCGIKMTLGNPTTVAYQNFYFDLLRKVAAHIKTRDDWYRALAYVKPSGANLVSHENRLPKRCKSGCVCNTQLFAQNGYTSSGLYAFYQAQTSVLATEFPGKTMSYALIQDGFPRINDKGDYERQDGTSSGGQLPGGTEQTQTIIDNGQASYGLRFAVSHNGLQTIKLGNCQANPGAAGCPNRWVVQEGKEGQVTGFQTTNAEGVANPADVDSALQNEWLNSQGIYVELYEERFWEGTHQPNGVLDPMGSGLTLKQWGDQLDTRRLSLFPTLPDPFPPFYSFQFTRTQSGSANQTLYYVHGAKCGIGNSTPAAIVIRPANAPPSSQKRRAARH